MEFITALASALVVNGVKALLGPAERRGDAALGVLSSAAEQIVRSMLATADETARSLDRIEAKVDRLLVAPYRQAIDLGYRNLGLAAAAHRSAADRSRLLDLAVQNFATARATAPAPEEAVNSEMLVALSWLARGSPQDFVASTTASADTAFAGLCDAARDYWDAAGGNKVYELATKRADVFSRTRRLFTGELYDKRLVKEIQVELRKEYLSRRNRRAELFNEVQDLRRAYAMRTAEQAPRLWGFFTPGLDEVSLSVPQSWLERGFSVSKSPVIEPGMVAGQAVYIGPTRTTAIHGSGSEGYVVDTTVTLGTDGIIPSVMLGWRSLNDRVEPFDRAVPTESVPLLPAQVGLPIWHGKTLYKNSSPSRLALRCTTMRPPGWLAVSVSQVPIPGVQLKATPFPESIFWAQSLNI